LIVSSTRAVAARLAGTSAGRHGKVSIPTPWVRIATCESEDASREASEPREASRTVREMEEFMSQADENTHTATVAEAQPQHAHRTLVRANPSAPHRLMSKRSCRTEVRLALLMAFALVMIAAPVYVFLGEKKIDVSPSLWSAALDFCRVVTGLFGIIGIVSVVTERRSGARGDGLVGSVAGGAALIGAAVVGLGLVIVVTALGGAVLLYGAGAIVAGEFRASR
jgi:hypothetical protein